MVRTKSLQFHYPLPQKMYLIQLRSAIDAYPIKVKSHEIMLEKSMITPQCHICGAALVQIKLTEDSEVGWYCVACDSDVIAEQEEAPTEIDAD